ncbi:RNA polymerase sigma factor [Hymenobacter terricola]|uniref:RNA polymerase sigma factor n=1 Tax=Hymenobacter terricola TaxID=2819236 RepID=UPI001B310B01|nr:sigma-70 family RNA polymerase sigma factor [Hymenobacter terricola]
MSFASAEHVVEHLFRHEAGRLHALLLRWLGVAHFAVAEDLVQDTLVEALTAWRLHGVPDNPAGWLYRVAQRKTLDWLRREQRRGRIGQELRAAEQRVAEAAPHYLPEELTDSELRTLFVCCHPALSPAAQVALCLKTLGGLSVAEIAAAFLTSPDTITKRLFRSKETLRTAGVSLEVPTGAELTRRLAAVLHALYLLFSEGYDSEQPAAPIRQELCAEALRLALLLTRQPRTDCPDTHALLALFCLQAARLPARTDAQGQLVLLEQQDRRRWSQPLIARGVRHLARAADAPAASAYHLQAGIALEHCRAPTYAATDWLAIRRLYDHLLALHPSSVVALHRAVAVARADGPARGLQAMAQAQALTGSYLYHAVLGDLHQLNGDPAAARHHLTEALQRTTGAARQQLLRRKLEGVGFPG